MHVAKLARLELTEEEVVRMQSQLSDILEAVGKVAELDLEGVPATSHPLDLVNRWREDEPRASWPRERMLALAPEAERGSFKVPPT